jgi:hypothetical protein
MTITVVAIITVVTTGVFEGHLVTAPAGVIRPDLPDFNEAVIPVMNMTTTSTGPAVR